MTSYINNDQINQKLSGLRKSVQFAPIQMPMAEFEAMARELMAYRDAFAAIEGVGLTDDQVKIVSVMQKQVTVAWALVREANNAPPPNTNGSTSANAPSMVPEA